MLTPASNSFRELPQCGRYRAAIVDPPWRWRPWSHRGDGKSASKYYRTAPLEEICALPIGELMAADAVLFLWVVQSMLPEGLRVLEAWGFGFKTVGFIWIKMRRSWDPPQLSFAQCFERRLGLGYHTRSGAEQCWIATRGKGYRRLAKDVPQVLHAPIRAHSQKPDEIVMRIERLIGDLPRIELFARTKRPGWDAWGDELGKFDPAENVP